MVASDDVILTARELAVRWRISPATIATRHSVRPWLLPTATPDPSGRHRLLFRLSDVTAYERRKTRGGKQMSTQKHITPADYGATYNKYLHAWRWWADDHQELCLAVYDDTNLNIDRDPNRPYEIECYWEANEGITVTQLEQLREVIEKALACRKALLKQKQEGE